MIMDSDIDILRRAGLWREVQSLVEDHRLFIDVNDETQIGEFEKLIENESVRNAFSWGLLEIIADYRTDIEQGREKKALNRLARLFGVETPMQTGWYTHISGKAGESFMLTLHAGDGIWYNFMVCKDFMMVEKSKPSTKHIIRLYGAAFRGKTPTAKKVFYTIKSSHPKHAIIYRDDDEVKGLFFIGNAMVGIDSQGDPTGGQIETLGNFVSMGCQVNFICSRNHGHTVSEVDKFKHTYIIVPEGRVYEPNVLKQDEVNTKQAEHIVEIIEEFASIV